MTLDTKLVAQRFAKCLTTYNQTATVQRAMADDLVARLGKCHPDGFKQVFEFGCGSGAVTRKLSESFSIEHYIVNDLVAGSEEQVRTILSPKKFDWRFIAGDATTIEIPTTADLIISGSTIHWLADSARFIKKVHAHLAPGGIFAFSTFGPQTFKEIRALTGQGLSYKTAADYRLMLAGDFKIIDHHEYVETARFDNPLAILKHIKETGVGGISKQSWGKKRLQEFVDNYIERFSDGKKVLLTYEPMLFIARKQESPC